MKRKKRNLSFFKARLAALGENLSSTRFFSLGRGRPKSLSEASSLEDSDSAPQPPVSIGASQIALRVGSEFMATIGVSGFLGWQCDGWFSTSPIFLLIFLLFGMITGFWNMYRLSLLPVLPVSGVAEKKSSDLSSNASPRESPESQMKSK